jgi:hypothetical protein
MLAKATQVSDVAHGPLVIITIICNVTKSHSLLLFYVQKLYFIYYFIVQSGKLRKQLKMKFVDYWFKWQNYENNKN